jgi:succinyl-CoA synthetase beta subunit
MGLLKKYGIPVPAGDAAKTVQEAVNVAKKFEKNGIVVKAQVLAGGRGKGKFDNGFQGGVHLVKSTGEVKTVAEKMLGARLITKQTGAGGKPCDTLYICERKSVGKEFYFAILMDRATAGPMLVGSSEGGMDIEAVAAKNPSAIVKIPLDLNVGLKKDVAVGLAKKLGFSPKAQDGAADIMQKLYKLFVEKDSTMVEINPMAETKEGQGNLLMVFNVYILKQFAWTLKSTLMIMLISGKLMFTILEIPVKKIPEKLRQQSSS